MQHLPLTAADPRSHPWRLNTSNPAKVRDYRALMAQEGLELVGQSDRDLAEIDSDPLQTVVHKASSLPEDWLLVDDGSLDVEGCAVGVNVRWLIAALPSMAGRRALMRVLIAFREQGAIFVCEGAVAGEVVPARGSAPPGFSILPLFQPLGRRETLAERRDDQVNPRAQAIANLAAGRGLRAYPPIDSWQGGWQGGDVSPGGLRGAAPPSCPPPAGPEAAATDAGRPAGRR